MQTLQYHPKNVERFKHVTGKTDSDYYLWASAVGRKVHINASDRLICEKFDLYTISHLQTLLTSLPSYLPAEQVDEYILENSENPYELAALWTDFRAAAESWVSIESILNEALRPFPKTDFERFGDSNWISDVSRKWFRKEGTGLDVQIAEISETYCLSPSIDDAIAFVRAFRPGSYQNPESRRAARIEERFREITGFRLKSYYAEHLIKSCSFTRSTNEEVPF